MTNETAEDRAYARGFEDGIASNSETDEQLKAHLKLVQKKYSKLWAALFAVQFYLDKPYPDDTRWTPWSRFVGPATQMMQAALKGEDIGDLEGMHRDNQSRTNSADPSEQHGPL